MSVHSYRDLVVWQKGMQVAREVYGYTQLFPTSELYGLVSQMRRAAVSIPSNIAEGFYRKTWKDRKQFFNIAYSSGAELETQITLAKDLFPKIAYNTAGTENLLGEVMRMLNTMTDRH